MMNRMLRACWLTLCLTGFTAPSLVLASPFAAPGLESAQINGGPGSPNRDVFEISFTAINGDNISPREVLWLEPGRYEIQVRVDERFTISPEWQIRRPRSDDEFVSFEITLEAGKRYDIRGQYNRNSRQRPYDIIVDRVVDQSDR